MTRTRIVFHASHHGGARSAQMLDAYALLLEASHLGQPTHFWLGDFENNDLIPGSLSSLRARLEERPNGHFAFRTDKNIDMYLGLEAGDPRQWQVRTLGMELDRATLSAMVGLCEKLFLSDDPPLALELTRDESDLRFAPSPPVARQRHVITTTDADVAETYDDPTLFWRQWATVHKAGDRRLCIRAREDADLRDYLARTFEGNYALARVAKPGLTKYGLPDRRVRKRLETEYPDFWELGPFEEEKAGIPALTLVGRDPATDTIHYTGFIERDGKEEHGRVQIRELIDVKDQGFSEAGDRIPGRVHVVFLDEWMARQERRPLRDVGARVFFYAKDGTKVEVTD